MTWSVIEPDLAALMAHKVYVVSVAYMWHIWDFMLWFCLWLSLVTIWSGLLVDPSDRLRESTRNVLNSCRGSLRMSFPVVDFGVWQCRYSSNKTCTIAIDKQLSPVYTFMTF